jgi:hypothetical protein
LDAEMGLGLGFMDFLDDIDNMIEDKGRSNVVDKVSIHYLLIIV